MMKLKLLIPLLILLIPIFSILLIQKYYTDLPKDTLIEGLVGQPTSLYPITSPETEIDFDLESLIFRGLLKYDKNGELVSDLAQSWEIAEDELEYTFHLREDAIWHDGKKFTSNDVLFTAKRVSSLKEVEIEKIDEFTVKFRLRDKFSPFLDLLTVGIIPEHVDMNRTALRAIGTGDFKVSDITFKGDLVDSIVLDRVSPVASNEKANKKINRIVFRFFENEEEMVTAAKLKQIDALSKMDFHWPGFRSYKAPLLSRYYALFFNVKKEGYLSDLDFRKTLARNTPREMIVKDVFDEKVKVINGPIQDSWAQEMEIERYAYEPTTETQFEGELTLVVPKTAEHIQTGKIIKDSWSKLGIQVNLREVELSEMTERVIKPHEFDALLLGQEVGRDPDRYSLWHSTQVDFPGLNFTGYKQVRVDKALEKGRQTLDREERKKHYSIFQKILSQDVAAIYLYQPYYYYTVSEKISGIDLGNLYFPADRFSSLYEWRVGVTDGD